MRILNLSEIQKVSGATIYITKNNSEVSIFMSDVTDKIELNSVQLGCQLILKGDGKAFINNLYLETFSTPKNVYTPYAYFTISSNYTNGGWNYVINPLS